MDIINEKYRHTVISVFNRDITCLGTACTFGEAKEIMDENFMKKFFDNGFTQKDFNEGNGEFEKWELDENKAWLNDNHGNNYDWSIIPIDSFKKEKGKLTEENIMSNKMNYDVKFYRGASVVLKNEGFPRQFGIVYDVEYHRDGHSIYTVIPVGSGYDPFNPAELRRYRENELLEAKPVFDKFSVDCLSEGQYRELCQNYITRFCEDPSGPCDSDIEAADEMVAEDVVYRYYENSLFSDDDFHCSSPNKKTQNIKLLKEQDSSENQFVADRDVILADLIKLAEIDKKGISDKLFTIWENTSDEKTVEAVFYLLTGERFQVYLEKCLKMVEIRSGKNERK